MFSSRTERSRGWRTFHLLLAGLLGFLILLGSVALLLLRYSAMQPSVRQLALPLTTIVDLIDASDAHSNSQAQAALAAQHILRAPAPPAPAAQMPVPFLEALVSYLRQQTGRQVHIERTEDGGTRLWISTARGDWTGVPMEPLRTLVAQFALLIVLIALALAMLAAWLLARRLAAPLERLAGVAARLPEPVDAQEFRVSGPREVQILGNRLADALGRIDSQRRERDLLLAGLSHDLRTPLMRLLLRIDLIDAIPEDERSALSVDIHELDRRIDRFIEHARTGAEEPMQTLDLVALLRPQIDASVARDYPWQLGPITSALLRGQPGVLGRLLANLIDNAEQHGAAPFRATLELGDKAHWHLRLANRVCKTRIGGAPPQHRGFGLSLCRQIAQAHGGNLDHGYSDDDYWVELTLPAA